MNVFKLRYDRCAILGVVAFILTFIALTLFYTQSSRADEYPIGQDRNQGVGY